MDTKSFTKYSDIIKYRELHWYLVQYNNDPHKFVRKVVRSHEIIWNENVPIYNDPEQKEPVLVREKEKIFVGYVIYTAANEQEALSQLNFLQHLSMKVLYSPYGFNEIVDKIYFEHNFWILLLYTTSTAATIFGGKSVFGIYHRNEVVLKRENHANNIVGYIQDQDTTQKGLVVKISHDISDLTLMVDTIRDEMFKIFNAIGSAPDAIKYANFSISFQNNPIENLRRRQELIDEVDHLEDKMYNDSESLIRSYFLIKRNKEKNRRRIIYLQHVAKVHNIPLFYNN